MLLSVHAIEGSASTPTAEHQRRRPRIAGDRAGKQNRQIIGALVERFRHFSDLLLHLVALIPATKILTRRRLIPGQPLVASRTRLASQRQPLLQPMFQTTTAAAHVVVRRHIGAVATLSLHTFASIPSRATIGWCKAAAVRLSNGRN
ncbi:MAG: hypothetical protein QOD97_705 [Mycobacterium sp.]|nr:hypothetical protein [Mycobacterium sp.]